MDAVIELEVGTGDGSGARTVRVLRSTGSDPAEGVLDLDVDALIARRTGFEATVLASAVQARKLLTPGETEIQRVGAELFDRLFTGEVGTAYRTSLAIARTRGELLRLRLRLTDPALAALPWEALYDRASGSYVCRRNSLIRQIAAPEAVPPLEVEPPLRILGLVSSPVNLPPLDVAAERSRLERALAPQLADGRVRLDWLEDVSWERLHERLLGGPWHVLHYIGHSRYEQESDEGVLAFCGEGGRVEFVGASALADLLDEAEPKPRLVVLNSCGSGANGVSDLYSGTASALVRSGIDGVVAMQYTISDDAAIAFARGFYSALAHGRTVDESARSGRISIVGLSRDTLEWVTPVLYLRGEDTRLFDIAPIPGAPPVAAAAAGPAFAAPTVEEPLVPESRRPDPPVSEPTAPAPPGEASVDLGTEHPDTRADAPGATASGRAGSGSGGHGAGGHGGFGAERPPDSRPPAGPTSDARRRRRLGWILAGGALAVAAAVPIAWNLFSGEGSGGSGVPAAGDAAPAPETADVPVDLAEYWTDTGLECVAGARLDITASGTAQHAEGPGNDVGPDGLADPGAHRYNVEGVPDLPTVALLGSVDERQPYFLVGSEFHGICPSDGKLELGINDAGLQGNEGVFDAVVSMTPQPGFVSSAVLTIPTTTTWTSTLFDCRAGQRLQFVASGRVQHGPEPDRFSGPDGTADFDPSWNVEGLEDVNHAALIGRLGEEPPFLIGRSAEVDCPTDGLLRLGVNDDGADVGENEGEFTVAIVVTEGD